MNLSSLTREDILHRAIPMKDLLEGSVYYPACDTDGRPMKYCNTIWRKLGVNSFVYCDFAMPEGKLLDQLRTVRGYRILAHRSLYREEYIPEGWELGISEKDASRYFDTLYGNTSKGIATYVHWVVFETASRKNSVFRPKRISLIYVGGEGVATFQQFYCHHHVAPKMLCFIQCWGWAGNWTDFTDPDAAFAATLRHHPECIPEYVCIGSSKEINGALRIKGTEYLGAKLVGHYRPASVQKSLGYEPVCIRDGEDRVHLAIMHKRTYLLMSLYRSHLSHVIYDVTDSKYDIETIADELVLKEKKGILSRAECLNTWLGFKESIYKDFYNEDIPELDIEYSSDGTDKSIQIIDTCLNFYKNEGINVYTDRMQSYVDWAYHDLSRHKEPQTQKLQEAQILLFHMKFFCRRIN